MTSPARQRPARQPRRTVTRQMPPHPRTAAPGQLAAVGFGSITTARHRLSALVHAWSWCAASGRTARPAFGQAKSNAAR